MDRLFGIIQRAPLANKIAVVGLILGLMVGGHYYLIYLDQDKEVGQLGRKLATLEEELQEKQEIAGNLSKFKKKVEYLNQKLEEKKKNLPDDSNMDQLLKTLNELSEKSDIRILSFTPMAEIRKNFYAAIPVSMQISGNYSEILTFLDKISKEDRIINVSDISMTKPEVKSGKVVLSASCLAKTFRSLPPAKAGGTSKTKKKKKRR